MDNVIAGDVFTGIDSENLLSIETDGKTVELSIGSHKHGFIEFRTDAAGLDTIIAHAQHVRDQLEK